jgi:N6-L-threonylcarbamoyladenine synthase
MKILSIETSCDETAISLLEVKGGRNNPVFTVRANAIASQTKIHEKYGGVYPMMAKREHSKNIWPLFIRVLKEAKCFKLSIKNDELRNKERNKIEKILEREPELLELFLKEISKLKKPKIDIIAVTYGPGLEPALWVGLNFAKALAQVWDLKMVPVNHMEGHIFSVFAKAKKFKMPDIKFPVVSLLVSGGHTEIVLVDKLMNYRLLGETLDDAAGEAFDKVARLLGLPYPGGPQISEMAKKGKENPKIRLPRPMIATKDYNFSFSGLKTAVLYLVRDLKKEHSNILENVGMLAAIAKEFQEAVVEVLVKKTMKAVAENKAHTLIVAGGVAANKRLRQQFEKEAKNIKRLKLYFPTRELSTDNSIMIAVSGYYQSQKKKQRIPRHITACGNLKLE